MNDETVEIGFSEAANLFPKGQGRDPSQSLSEKLAVAECQSALAQLDLEWEIERDRYEVGRDRNKNRLFPTRRNCRNFIIAGSVFALVFVGAILTIAGLIRIPCLLSFLFFPPLLMLYLVGAVACLWSGISQCPQAIRYEQALREYQERRRRIQESLVWLAESGIVLAAENLNPEKAESLAIRFAEARCQTEIAKLDREWEIEKQKHYIFPKRGSKYLPSSSNGPWMIALGLIAIPILIAVGSVFPIGYVGFLFAGVLFLGGIMTYAQGRVYEAALLRYQTRRNALTAEQFLSDSQHANTNTE